MAKKSFAPILISPVLSENDVKVHIVSDKLEVIDAVLDMIVMDFDGKVVFQQSIPTKVKANHSEIAATLSKSQLVNDTDESRLVFISRLKRGNEILVENLTFFKSPKDLDLKNPKISTNIIKMI